MTYLAVVVEDQFTPGRYAVLRRNRIGRHVSVTSCPSAATAETERRRLQRLYDEERDPTPEGKGQLAFRFFDADTAL